MGTSALGLGGWSATRASARSRPLGRAVAPVASRLGASARERCVAAACRSAGRPKPAASRARPRRRIRGDTALSPEPYRAPSTSPRAHRARGRRSAAPRPKSTNGARRTLPCDRSLHVEIAATTARRVRAESRGLRGSTATCRRRDSGRTLDSLVAVVADATSQWLRCSPGAPLRLPPTAFWRASQAMRRHRRARGRGHLREPVVDRCSGNRPRTRDQLPVDRVLDDVAVGDQTRRRSRNGEPRRRCDSPRLATRSATWDRLVSPRCFGFGRHAAAHCIAEHVARTGAPTLLASSARRTSAELPSTLRSLTRRRACTTSA